jgi:hypothetical protein
MHITIITQLLVSAAMGANASAKSAPTGICWKPQATDLALYLILLAAFIFFLNIHYVAITLRLGVSITLYFSSFFQMFLFFMI